MSAPPPLPRLKLPSLVSGGDAGERAVKTTRLSSDDTVVT